MKAIIVRVLAHALCVPTRFAHITAEANATTHVQDAVNVLRVSILFMKILPLLSLRRFGMWVVVLALITGASLFLRLHANPLTPQPEVEAVYNVLLETENATFGHDPPLSESIRADIIGKFYRHHFHTLQTEAVLGRMDAKQISLLLLAAYRTAFYTLSNQELADLMRDLKALERLGAATNADYVMAVSALVAQRRFREARSLQNDHALSMPPTPNLLSRHAVEAPTRLIVKSESELLREHLDLKSKEILVVAHPDCHFTQDAARAISVDPELHQIFSSHSQWLAPQDQTTNFANFVQWNQRYPNLQISIAFARSEYPAIDSWSTPTFYFLRDGRIVSSVSGWPSGGNRKRIIAEFRKLENRGLKNSSTEKAWRN